MLLKSWCKVPRTELVQIWCIIPGAEFLVQNAIAKFVQSSWLVVQRKPLGFCGGAVSHGENAAVGDITVVYCTVLYIKVLYCSVVYSTVV